MLKSLHDFLEVRHDLARPRLQLLTGLVPCTQQRTHVVIADIDFNVLSCFSMQERGWRTVLGAKNSYVVKGKMRFPIQMAERAWWMTVKSTRKDNGVKPMDVDRVGGHDQRQGCPLCQGRDD